MQDRPAGNGDLMIARCTLKEAGTDPPSLVARAIGAPKTVRPPQLDDVPAASIVIEQVALHFLPSIW
jgi:hypothetical protein